MSRRLHMRFNPLAFNAFCRNNAQAIKRCNVGVCSFRSKYSPIMSFYSCVFVVTILYLRAVVRAKTVSIFVRHTAYFTVHFCILCK